ncbi:MAG: YjbR [Bradyrhizobium sp.]|jgi:hypothetical protein|nr:YjbR [Bradyrhizobium sp.]
MATSADVRNAALALDGVREIDHWGRPAYRTLKRIFAVMRPDGLFLHLPEQRKQFLFEAAPDVFVRFMWGKTANVIVQIAGLSRKELEALLREAWQHATPPAKAAKPPSPHKTAAKKKTKRQAPGAARR